MILTLTPNPAVDLTVHVERVVPGASHRVPPVAAQAGGKGVNVARVLHQRGIPALAVAPVGGATGRLFRSDIEAAGVPHLLVDAAAPTRRSIAVVDEGSGETTIFNERGVALGDADWRAIMAAVAGRAADAACLVGSGSLPPGAPTDLYARLVALAHGLGIPSVIDATGPALMAAAEAGATLLKPNLEELRECTGEADPLRGARRLVEVGAASVLVSLGAAGMMLVAGAAIPPLRARLAEPLVGNATGAGDAAVAAAAHALAGGDTAGEGVLRLATAWSAAAVLSPVAGRLGTDPAGLAAQLMLENGWD